MKYRKGGRKDISEKRRKGENKEGGRGVREGGEKELEICLYYFYVDNLYFFYNK